MATFCYVILWRFSVILAIAVTLHLIRDACNMFTAKKVSVSSVDL